MSNYITKNNAKIKQAIGELQGIIRERWPSASFTMTPGGDDPKAIYLNATIDIQDTDEVIDIVISRIFYWQDQGLPIHVIPNRPLKRVLEELAREKKSKVNQTYIPSLEVEKFI